jgi:HEAT repeat protein
MSIAVLTQVYDEVRRLSIAGSVVAPGDFRLKKLIAPLEQAGAKSPVFAKVAQAVQAVVESTEKTSASALLELSTLINAILYTQGETGLPGELKPIETVNLGPQTTQASARVIKPLLVALTESGSGRVTIIKDALDRGAFRDLRLVKPTLTAIDDKNVGVSHFVATYILPLYGKAILPELRSKFDMKGKGGHLRRLALMHQLDPEGTRETVKQALEDGSKEMKVVAMECLGDSPEDLSFLLEQAGAKAKEVRTAALKSLAKLNEPEAVEALKKAAKGNDLDITVEPLRAQRNPQLLKFLIDECQQTLESVLKMKDKKAAEKNVHRLQALVQCLDGRDDPETEKQVLSLFGRRAEIAKLPWGENVNETVLNALANGSPKMRNTLIEMHAALPPEHLSLALHAAVESRTPAQVFELFSPYLTAKVDEKKKSRDPAWVKRGAIIDHVGNRYTRSIDLDDDVEFNEENRAEAEWDPRWLDVAVKHDLQDLVFRMARPGHAGCNALLKKCYEEELARKKGGHNLSEVVGTMIRVEHPEATACAIGTLKVMNKALDTWGVRWFARNLPDLPAESIAEFDALIPTLDERIVDCMLAYVEALRTKSTQEAVS